MGSSPEQRREGRAAEQPAARGGKEASGESGERNEPFFIFYVISGIGG